MTRASFQREHVISDKTNGVRFSKQDPFAFDDVNLGVDSFKRSASPLNKVEYGIFIRPRARLPTVSIFKNRTFVRSCRTKTRKYSNR